MRLIPVVLLAALGYSCSQSGEGGIVAEVNGYKIVASELDRYYASQYREDETSADTDDQAQMLRLNLLRELIDRQLMLQRAESLGLMAVD